MFCIKCGKENTDDSKFCRYCGANLDFDEVNNKNAEENSVNEFDNNKTLSKTADNSDKQNAVTKQKSQIKK